MFFQTSKRLRGPAPPAAGPRYSSPLFQSKFHSKTDLQKRAESGAKRRPQNTPFRLKSPKQTQNDSQDPFWEVLWNTPWKKRRHQRPPGSPKDENKRPETQSDRAGLVQTQLHIFHKSSKCHRKCLRVWPLRHPFSTQSRII